MNTNKMNWKKSKVFKFLASIKLAVVVILSIAVLAAAGTIVESRFDADAATAWVYRSVWMYIILCALCINLIAVMIDRWPWKMRHSGFVMAHIGIIILLTGGIITQKFGIDGSMYLPLGGKSKSVTMHDKEITIYSTFNGESYTELYRSPANFLVKSAKENPLEFPVMEGVIKVNDSMNYVTATERFVPISAPISTDKNDKNDKADKTDKTNSGGVALRFQIQNNQVSMAEWLFAAGEDKTANKRLGPLTIFWEQEPPNETSPVNALYFQKVSDQELKYTMVSKDAKHKTVVGKVTEAQSFETPWMGFKVKILRYIPHAKRDWDFKPVERPNAMTTTAIQVSFKDQTQWVQLGDIVRFFTDKAAYVVKFGNRNLDIGEEIKLKDFHMGMYQGTRRAMSYESVVEVPVVGEKLISMNEPLKYNGFTFYQASFENGEDGKPAASILSVNYDPGRWIKYLGCLIMVFGIISLFWWKKKAAKGN